MSRSNVLWLISGLFFLVFVLFLFFLNNQNLSLISPVLSNSKLKIAEDIWFPKDPPKSFENVPTITAEAAYFIETNSGEVLYAKNHTQKMQIASLIKIMTAVVTLETRNPDDLLEVSEAAASMEPDKMFLITGEKLSVKELLDGVFLVSANDAAEVLAEKSVGRREEFINLMNAKAAQLGMKDTLFINPTGLEEDGKEQFSSAYDLAIMSRYAIFQHPKLLEISSQPYVSIEVSPNHQNYELFSGINLLTTYPGVLGFKTGFTPEAGLTLVTIARKGDKEVLGVLLNSTERRDDAKALLDYSFKKLGVN